MRCWSCEMERVGEQKQELLLRPLLLPGPPQSNHRRPQEGCSPREQQINLGSTSAFICAHHERSRAQVYVS